jgi:hypothetical protein
MLRTTTWLAIVALAAAGGCKKKAARPIDAAPATDAAVDATPSVQSKLDEAARVKGDIHAPRPEDPVTKTHPQDATDIKKRR